MKKLILIISILGAINLSADVWVDGYYKSNGTYVSGHFRSDPDGIKENNYSYRGNSYKSNNYNSNNYNTKKSYKSDKYNTYKGYYNY